MKNTSSFFTEDEPSKVFILGIDPGTTTVGFCVMEIDPVTVDRKSFEAFTIHCEKPCGGRHTNDDLLDSHSALFVRLQEIRARFKNILEFYQPVQVATELPFFNGLHPTAFAPLIQVLSVIEDELYQWSPHKPLYRIENTTAKALIYPTSKEDRKVIYAIKGSKYRIIACLEKNPQFQWINHTVYDEHSIDAILIAETQRRRLQASDFHVRY